MTVIIALMFWVSSVGPYTPTYTSDSMVISREQVPEVWASVPVSIGRTSRVRIERRPERWLLRIEQCKYLKPDCPCELVVETVRVTRAVWEQTGIGDVYEPEPEDEWWEPW